MPVSQYRKALAASVTVAAITASAAIFGTGNAAAAAYAKEVKTPTTSKGVVQGRANVHTDCADTYGCYTYVKIERLLDNESSASPVPWLNTWQHVTGKWASDGWNSVTFKVEPGSCAKYRTVVDTYNDAPGDSVLGVSLGPVELNLGNGVNRYHKTEKSSTLYLCAYA